MLTRSDFTPTTDVMYSAMHGYACLGFDTLPLKPNSKVPINRNWQNRDPLEMWKHALESINIGIRCGGKMNLLVIDCDDKSKPGTFENVVKILERNGFPLGSYPVVQSASGVGRHIYLILEDNLDGNIIKLRNEVGAGDVRFGSGSYVVAPPSKYDHVLYKLVSGSFHQIPTVSIGCLNKITQTTKLQNSTHTSKSIPKRTMWLLRGNGGEYYKSRSELEQAILVGLCNKGFDFDSVLRLYLKYPAAGRFKSMYYQNQSTAIKWLRYSFDKAKTFSDRWVSDKRKIAYVLFNNAKYGCWPGKHGAYDRVVYMAHLMLAFNSGKLIYHASLRCLAENAGVSKISAGSATKRLKHIGLLKEIRGHTPSCAKEYSLIYHTQNLTLPHSSDVRECTTLASHDLFRWKGLTKSDLQIYEVLLNDSYTISELREITGRSPQTINRSVSKMSWAINSLTGKVIQMVNSIEGKYFGNNVDLDLLAKLHGTQGKRNAQILVHNKDRFIQKQNMK